MFNWFDGEVEVQRHKDASRAAAERYAADEAVRARAGRSLFRRLRDLVRRVLTAWSGRRAADPLTGERQYDGNRVRSGD